MLFLVVAFVMLAIVIGSVSYLPWPVTLVAGAAITAWLATFTVRERRRRGRAGRA